MKFIASFFISLISLGTIMAQDTDTSLHTAVWNNDFNQVKKTIEEGYDLETKNEQYQTAFYVACLRNNLEITSYLIGKGANTKNFEYYVESPLDICIKNKNIKLFKLLYENNSSSDYDADEKDYTANFAASEGNLEILTYLITNNAVDIKDKDKLVNLLNSAISNNKTDVITYLLSLGIDINYSSEYQASPIHHAAEESNPEIIKYLIDRGANPNPANEYDYSALESAIIAEKEDNAKLLMKYDSLILIDTNYTFKILSDLGNYKMNSLANQLIEQIGDFSAYKSKKVNPLINTIYSNNRELVDILIQHHMDINAPSEYGETALNNLVVNLDYYDTNIYINLNNQKYLIEKGANPNIAYYGSPSPFQNLVKFSSENSDPSPTRDSLLNLVKFYLSKGADILVSDDYGSSAFSVADDELKEEFRKILSSSMFIYEPTEISTAIPDKINQLWSRELAPSFLTGEEIKIPYYFYSTCKTENIEPWTEIVIDEYSYNEEDYSGIVTTNPEIILAKKDTNVSILNRKARKILFTTENRFDSANAFVLGDKILFQTDSAYYLTDEFFTKLEQNAFTDYLVKYNIKIQGNQKAVNLNKHLILAKVASDSTPILLHWSNDFGTIERIDISSILNEVKPDLKFTSFSTDGNWLLVGENIYNDYAYAYDIKVQFSLYFLSNDEKPTFSKRILVGPMAFTSPEIYNGTQNINEQGFYLTNGASYGQNYLISFESVKALIGVTDVTTPVQAQKSFAFSSAKVRKYLRKEKDKKLLELLKTLTNPDVIGDEGYSILHMAIRANKPEIVKILIDNGCNVNVTGIGGMTPLYLASLIKDNETTTSALIEHNADLSATTIYGSSIVFPASYFSFNNYLLSTLKESKTDFWQMDKMSRTPLYAAIKRQKPNFDFSIFFDGNISLQSPCYKGSSPLLTAIKEKNAWAITYLLSRKADIDYNYCYGNDNTPLIQALIDQETSLAKYLVYQGANVNKSTSDNYPLGLAITNSDNELAMLLINKGADVQKSNAMGMQAIHFAAQYDNAEILNVLLENGANIEAIDSSGNTALVEAVLNYSNECVELLLSKGANINFIDNVGTPVIYYSVSNYPALEMLLKSGANPLITSEDGTFPLQNALMNGYWNEAMLLLNEKYRSGYPDSVIKSMISLYINYNTSSYDSNKIDTLIMMGADLNSKDDSSYDILDYILSNGTSDDLLYLMRKGYDIYKTDSIDNPPMMRIFENFEDESLLKFVKNISNPAKLIEPGDFTLLHLAAKYERPLVMEYLLEIIPELIDAQDSEGNTALHHLATQYYPDSETIQKLINAGANTEIVNNNGQTYSQIMSSNEPSYDYVEDNAVEEEGASIIEDEPIVVEEPSDVNIVEETQDSGESGEEGYWFVEQNASFNGGDVMAFNNWVAEHIQYPVEAQKAGISGKVILQFSVDRKGNVCDVKIVRSVDPLLDAEALRVIKSSPNWAPAKQSGENVKQIFTIPIDFNLE